MPPTADATDPRSIRDAWRRELPDAPVASIPTVSALKQVAAALRRAREAALREAELDAATLDLLSTLRRAGPPYVLTTRELARRCLVTAGAISQRVARAEREGLVVRHRAPAGRVEVELAAAGHATVERGARLVLAADDALTSGLLPPEDLRVLEEVLTRWASAASRTPPDGRSS